MMDEQQIRMRLISDIEKLKSPKGWLYAGLPHFKALFGRDSLISSWQLLRYDATIAKNTLKILARFQGKEFNKLPEEEPGRILHIHKYSPHNIPKHLLKLFQYITHTFPYYGCVDATPLFIIVTSEYFRKTKDKELIKELWPNIEKAVNWMINYGDLDKDGFIEYKRKTPFGVRNQNWKDSLPYMNIKLPVAVAELQGYAYLAYKRAVLLAKGLNKEWDDWGEKAEDLKRKFNKEFWMGNFFALALDGNKQQVKEIASNAGHLLFTGIIDKDKIEKVVHRIFESDMFTSYGIRTHSSLSKYFTRSCHLGAIWPHDNWMIWIGLKKCGYKKEAEMVKNCLFKAHQELGYIPEYYNITDGKIFVPLRAWHHIPLRKPCCPQAWASGALLNMLMLR